jgi:hypothetical protein
METASSSDLDAGISTPLMRRSPEFNATGEAEDGITSLSAITRRETFSEKSPKGNLALDMSPVADVSTTTGDSTRDSSEYVPA